MTTTEQRPQATEPCPSWCVVEHTWDGLEFHKSVMTVVEEFGHTARANLFQVVGEGCEAQVVVAGMAMTPETAQRFARELMLLACCASAEAATR